MGLTFCYTMYIMKKGDVMSNTVNDAIKDGIADDVCAMADDDIWNVIHAIADDYGIDKLPYCKDNDTFIDTLISLKVADLGI